MKEKDSENTEKFPDSKEPEDSENSKEGSEGEAIEPEIFEDLPPEVRHLVQVGMRMHSFSGRLPNPIASKLTENHLTEIINASKEDDKRRFQDSLNSRWFGLAYYLVAIGVFIFLVVFLASKNPDLLNDILKIFGGFVGGIGAGYAIKSYEQKKRD